MICEDCANSAKCEAGKLDPKPQIFDGECGHCDGCSQHLTWKDAAEDAERKLDAMRKRIAEVRAQVAANTNEDNEDVKAVAMTMTAILDYIESGNGENETEEEAKI